MHSPATCSSFVQSSADLGGGSAQQSWLHRDLHTLAACRDIEMKCRSGSKEVWSWQLALTDAHRLPPMAGAQARSRGTEAVQVFCIGFRAVVCMNGPCNHKQS